MLPGNFLDRSIRREKARSPAGEQPETASWTPLRSRDAKRRGSPVRYADLERQKYIEDLLTITALLDVSNLAAASICDTRLRDLVGVDRIVALDILRSHNPCDNEFAYLEVDANFLLSFDHQISVRQYLRHDAGDVRLELFRPVHRALAIAGRAGIGSKYARRHRRIHDRHFWFSEEVSDARILSHGACAFGFVFNIRLIGDVDLHCKDVSNLMRTLILEEGARTISPKRIRIVCRGLRRRHRHLDRFISWARGWIVHRSQWWLLADRSKPIDISAPVEKGTCQGGEDCTTHNHDDFHEIAFTLMHKVFDGNARKRRITKPNRSSLAPIRVDGSGDVVGGEARRAGRDCHAAWSDNHA